MFLSVMFRYISTMGNVEENDICILARDTCRSANNEPCRTKKISRSLGFATVSCNALFPGDDVTDRRRGWNIGGKRKEQFVTLVSLTMMHQVRDFRASETSRVGIGFASQQVISRNGIDNIGELSRYKRIADKTRAMCARMSRVLLRHGEQVRYI